MSLLRLLPHLTTYELNEVLEEAIRLKNTNDKFQSFDTKSSHMHGYSIEVYKHRNYSLGFEVNDDALLRRVSTFIQVLAPLLDYEQEFHLVDENGVKIKNHIPAESEMFIEFNSKEAFFRVKHKFEYRKTLNFSVGQEIVEQ